MVCVVLFLIELGINKFCGLGGERFLWCDMRVIRCWRECGSLLNLGLRVSEFFWWVLRVWGGRCYVGDVLMCWEMIGLWGGG